MLPFCIGTLFRVFMNGLHIALARIPWLQRRGRESSTVCHPIEDLSNCIGSTVAGSSSQLSLSAGVVHHGDTHGHTELPGVGRDHSGGMSGNHGSTNQCREYLNNGVRTSEDGG